MLPRSLTLLTALALSSSLSAQEVHFSGKVEDGEGVCYYCPGFDYVLDYTHTSLSSPAINLQPFVGLHVAGTGQWNGSTTNPVIVVDAIQLAPQSFSIGGGGHIGSKLDFTAQGTLNDLSVLAVAFQDSFLPLGDAGVMFLDPQSTHVLGQGLVDSSGEFDIKIDVPFDPALIGLQVFGQAALIHPNGTLQLTNSDLKTLS